jgi:hypothetical protein
VDSSEFVPTKVYEFHEVAEAFGMKPAVLTWQSGIISRPVQNALIVIMRIEPDSIDYHDYWDGDDLIYGARGRKGDQRLSGVNKLLASNERSNFVFEAIGGAKLRFLGLARAVQHWWDRTPGEDGVARNAIRYVLRLGPRTWREICLQLKGLRAPRAIALFASTT